MPLLCQAFCMRPMQTSQDSVSLTRLPALLLASMLLVAGCGHSTPTSPPSEVQPHTINADPQWSPSGRRIVFVHYAQTLEERALGVRQIWYYDETTGISTYVA